MPLINSKTDLELYMKRTERQKEVLQFSTLFNDEEKEQLKECFNDLIKICRNRMEIEQLINKQHCRVRNN